MRDRTTALAGSTWLGVLLVLAPGLWMLVELFLVNDPTIAADPVEYVLRHLGFVAVVLLVATLLLVPLAGAFPKWSWLQALRRQRRLWGVSAGFYAVLHVAIHFVGEGGLATYGRDWAKPFFLSGALALMVLLLLLVTSIPGAVRYLGARRWKRLHRGVYLAAALALYHQIHAHKVFPVEVVGIFGPLVCLEVLRVFRFLRKSGQA